MRRPLVTLLVLGLLGLPLLVPLVATGPPQRSAATSTAATSVSGALGDVPQPVRNEAPPREKTMAFDPADSEVHARVFVFFTDADKDGLPAAAETFSDEVVAPAGQRSARWGESDVAAFQVASLQESRSDVASLDGNATVWVKAAAGGLRPNGLAEASRDSYEEEADVLPFRLMASDGKRGYFRAREAGPDPVAPALRRDHGDHQWSYGDGGAPAPEELAADARPETRLPESWFSLIVHASQESLTLFALAPQPIVTPGPANPLAQASMPFIGAATAGMELAADAPAAFANQHWIFQAAWGLALAAFVAWAFAPASLGAPLLRLFSRFDREDVLEHGRRALLFECVRAEPGVAFGRLAERVGLAPGVVQHHLRLLEQHGLVRRMREGRTTHFYPRGPRFPPPVVLAPRRQQILSHLQAEPGLSTPELARRLGQRVQSTWDHLRRLAEAGVLASARRGRATVWNLAAPAAPMV